MNEKIANKTVLVGMTGGLESTVAAYLLKKQGYRCIGIGMKFFDAGKNPGPFGDVVVSDLNKVKDICNYLDIPFYAVDASEIFANSVIDPTVGRILSGHTYEPLVFINLITIEVLIEKARKFNTNLIATGHYAKSLYNHKTRSYELSVANDYEHDQSYMLSRLEQKHLENLMLPLSEIRKKEVQKIGELIKVEYIKRSKDYVGSLMQDPRMPGFVEERSAKDLWKAGNIYDYRLESSLCEHDGIHRYYIGQSNIPSKPIDPIDPNKVVVMIVPFKGNVFIDYPDDLKYTHAFANRMLVSANLDLTQPMSVYVKLTPNSPEKIPCRLFFKNNSACLIEFETERKGLLSPGQYLVFYNRANEKGKVLGSAFVEVSGSFKDNDFHTLPVYKKEENEQRAKPRNTDKANF